MNEGVSEVVIRDDENKVVAWEAQKLDIHRPPGSGSKFGQFCASLQPRSKGKLRGKVTFSRKVSSAVELKSKVVGLMLNQFGDECQPQPMQYVE